VDAREIAKRWKDGRRYWQVDGGQGVVKRR